MTDIWQWFHGFSCVYSITSRDSFNKIPWFREQILKRKDSFGCPFFETSAKGQLNIKDGFVQLIREIQETTQIRIYL